VQCASLVGRNTHPQGMAHAGDALSFKQCLAASLVPVAIATPLLLDAHTQGWRTTQAHQSQLVGLLMAPLIWCTYGPING
jgi:hypothetical protein